MFAFNISAGALFIDITKNKRETKVMSLQVQRLQCLSIVALAVCPGPGQQHDHDDMHGFRPRSRSFSDIFKAGRW